MGDWYPSGGGGGSASTLLSLGVRAGTGAIVAGQSAVTITFSAPVSGTGYEVEVTIAGQVSKFQGNSNYNYISIENKTVNGFDAVFRAASTGAVTTVSTNNLTFGYVAIPDT